MTVTKKLNKNANRKTSTLVNQKLKHVTIKLITKSYQTITNESD